MFNRGCLCLMLSIMLISATLSKAQIVVNGTFNGNPGTNVPTDWQSCLNTSTVEVQPGSFGIINTPQDGNSFLGMACRSLTVPETAGTCEEVGQFLNEELVAGRCYRIEVYLAFGPELSVLEFRNPIDLTVFLGGGACENDLEIARFTSIDHTDWRRYSTSFILPENKSYLWLQGAYTSLPEYSGYILVDNVSIEETDTPDPVRVEFCAGQSATISSSFAEADSYTWNTGETDPAINVSIPGQYFVEIKLGDCTINEQFNVFEKENPTVNITSTNTICPGEQIRLDAFQSDATYLWQDGSVNSFFVVQEPGSYNVQVTLNECTSEQTIEILRGECDAILEMPNAFSPNNDGKNDSFTPIQAIRIPQMQTLIFNRWGHQIFSTTNLNIEWDGNLPNGQEAPPTTYYWSIRYVNLDGFVLSQKGTVNLIR